MRRVATFVAVAATTTVGLLYWLNDGDLDAALHDGRAAMRWNTDDLLREAGITARDPAPVPSAAPVLELDASAE